MSINNIAHISSVDKGLKMKIKRTKGGPNKVDAKHEVVKSDSRSVMFSSGQSVTSMAAAVFTSASNSSINVVSTVAATSRMSGSLATQSPAASVTTSLALPSSSLTLSLSAISSSSPSSIMSSASSSVLVTSFVTATNPTVTLLKSARPGLSSDAPCGNATGGKSPSKTASPGVPGTDAKDGKSPKTKAAYNKKGKDIKGKTDVTTSACLSLNPTGNAQQGIDGRTCVGIANQTLGSPQPPLGSSLPGVSNSPLTSEPRPGDVVHVKKENLFHDPYEFNAKVEDKIELPPKKLKLEKADCMETALSPQPPHQPSSPVMLPQAQAPLLPQPQQQPQKRSVGVDVISVGVATEPDCLGPCEPGTLVGLEGIVWKETDNGLLVVNVTWRGKTYVGTLMDATRYAWAPPRPNGCESPVSDFESRTPKGRGKRNCRASVQSSERLPEGRRLRKGRRGTVNSSSSSFTAPPSPAKSDLYSSNLKRKTKSIEVSNDKIKRSRSCSRGVVEGESPQPEDYIVCPEPNCHKKYKHMNGLRYHRTHAHQKSLLTGDVKYDDDDDEDDDEDKQEKKEKTTLSERSERMKAKERQRLKEQHIGSDRDSLDDDIPLKEIANKASGQVNIHVVGGVSSTKDKTEDELCNISNDTGTEGFRSNPETDKGEPELILAPTDIDQQNDSEVIDRVAVLNTDNTEMMETQPSVSSLVPCVSSDNETPSSSGVSCSGSEFNLPVMTSVKSQLYQVLSTVAVGGVTPSPQTITVNSRVTPSPHTITINSGIAPIPHTITINSGVTHIPQTSSANSGAIPITQISTTNSGVIQTPHSSTPTDGVKHTPEAHTPRSGVPHFSQTSTPNNGVTQIAPPITTNNGIMHIPQSTTDHGVTLVPPFSLSNPAHIHTPQTSTTNNRVSPTPQTSVANIGIPHIPHTSNTGSGTPAKTHTMITCATSQTGSTTAATVLAKSLTPDRQNSGKYPGFLKAITSVRPIVPAPSPQIVTMCNPHSQTLNSQPSTQSHGCLLKPIQPRPTIMGDYSIVSPSLSDLNKEKLRKRKKKKEKGSPGATPIAQDKTDTKGQMSFMETSDRFSDISHGEVYKHEQTAVITSLNPSKSQETSSPNNLPKAPLHSSLSSLELHNSVNSNTPLSGRSRMAIPPSTLSLSSYSPDNNAITDDVHSPAYSDISDANDSNSPLHDSPRKDTSLKKEQVNGPPSFAPDITSLSQHYGNMFYYGGHSHYLPHGINPQSSSTTLSKGLAKADDMEENKSFRTSESPHEKKGTRSAQEMELQQKSLINYYAHLPAAVQFQFNLSGYNSSALEPSPYAIMAQADQCRLLQQDSANRAEDGSGKRTPSGILPANRSIGSGYEFNKKSRMTTGVTDAQLDQKRTNDERDSTQRRNLNDGRHMLQEHVDMKPQLGLHHQLDHLPQDLQHNQQNYQLLKQQQQNDLMRAQIYQQHKQKVFENQRQDKRSSADMSNSGHNTSNQSSGVIPRHLSDKLQLEVIPPDAVKNEVLHPREISRPDSRLGTLETKRADVKDESPKLSSSTQELLSRSRPSSQSGMSNIPPTSTSCSMLPSLPPSLSATLPVPLVASLPTAAFPYAPYYQRPVQIDTMYRALNPHIIGYAGPAPAYIHPAQLGFRIPPVDPDRKSTEIAEPHRGDVPGMVVASSGYAPVHKIHELHEKGRPSPGVHSPALTKSTGGDNVNSPGTPTPGPVSEKVKDKQREYSSSPPTQRHVHTHHHTHVVGGFPPLYPPDAYSAMFGHPAAAAAIQTAPHAFPPPHPPAPKS